MTILCQYSFSWVEYSGLCVVLLHRVPTLEELSRSIEGVKASTRRTCVMYKLCFFVWFHIPPIIIRKLTITSCVDLVLCYIFTLHFMFKFMTLFMFHYSGYFCLHYSRTIRSHGSAIWVFINDPWEAMITLARLTGNTKRIFTPAWEGTTTFCLLRFKLKGIKCFILVSSCIKPMYVLQVQYCICWIFFTHSYA